MKIALTVVAVFLACNSVVWARLAFSEEYRHLLPQAILSAAITTALAIGLIFLDISGGLDED